MKYKIKIIQIVILALLVILLGFYPDNQLEAQTAPSQLNPADHTITLTKKVEVYDVLEMHGAVDQYQVKRGDSVLRLLQKRGLLGAKKGVPEDKMLELVRRLNPDVKDLNAISVGQKLNLPTTAPVQTAANLPRPGSPEAVAPLGEAPYQSPEANPYQGDPQITPALGAVAPGSQDFPSGNVGPLGTEPTSQVVYRTVKIRPGDTLEKLLRREGMGMDMIYRHLLKTTRRLNPNMRDTDLIFAGAELRIPAAGAYLRNLTGVDPQAVKVAAAGMAQGTANANLLPPPSTTLPRGNPAFPEVNKQAASIPKPNSGRVAVAKNPPPQVAQSSQNENVKSTIGLIFTRLGAKINTRGRLRIPAGAEVIEVDTAQFPMVETVDGSRVILDIGSRMAPETIASLENNPTPYHIFRTSNDEPLDQALARLWPMCNYFRVYDRSNIYEGGGDVKLKISADWIIWPTEAAWKAGQPLVVNRLATEGQRTSPQWTRFLEANGFTMLDIYQNTISDPPQGGPAADKTQSDWKIEQLNPRYSTLFAAELIKALGGNPEMSPRIQPSRGPDKDQSIIVPLMWKAGNTKVLLDFGDIPQGTIDILRQDGYRVMSVELETEAIIKGVLEGFQAKFKEELILRAPGDSPAMSISIKGWSATYAGRTVFITKTHLPPALLALGEPGLTVLTY